MDVRQLDHFENNFTDDFLDSIALFEEVELNEIDLPLCNAENTVENSDSDSGISVQYENTVNSSITTSGECGTLVSDFVLTEAVGACKRQFQSGLLQHEHAPIDLKDEYIAPKPIKIVKVIPKSLNTRAPVDSTQKIIPVHSFKSGAAATYVVATSTVPRFVNMLGTANVVSTSQGHSPPIYNKSYIGQEQFFENSCENPIGDDAILDKYDPVTHSDVSLEMHLRDFCGTVFSSSNPTPIRQLQTSYSNDTASPTHIATTNRQLLTRVGLERLRKKQERMIKNRHAASLSRLRKKEYLERLEMRYEQLKRENLNLWRQNEEWRVRCENLECSLNELQTQLNDLSPETLSSLPPDPLHSSPKLVLGGSALISETQSGVRDNIDNHSSSSICQFTKSNLLSTQHPTDRADRVWSPAPKVIPNPVFADARPHFGVRSRSGLTSLSGVVSRHRPGYQLNTGRSKLVATTSLLGVFSLFALNCLLSPLNSVQLTNPTGLVNQQIAHRLPAMVHSVGQRALLSVPVTADSYENSSHIGPSDSNANASIGSRCSKSNPAIANQSFDESSHVWQNWVIRNNRMKFMRPVELPGDPRIMHKTTVASAPSHMEFSHPRKENGSNLRKRKSHSRRPQVHRQPASEETLPFDPAGGDQQRFERSLQRFTPQPPWNWDDLLAAAGRRNDTVYVILPRLDTMYLHVADPIYEKLVTKITFIVPAYPTFNGTRGSGQRSRVRRSPTMLQVECDLRNVTLLHPLRPTEE